MRRLLVLRAWDEVAFSYFLMVCFSGARTPSQRRRKLPHAEVTLGLNSVHLPWALQDLESSKFPNGLAEYCPRQPCFRVEREHSPFYSDPMGPVDTFLMLFPPSLPALLAARMLQLPRLSSAKKSTGSLQWACRLIRNGLESFKIARPGGS